MQKVGEYSKGSSYSSNDDDEDNSVGSESFVDESIGNNRYKCVKQFSAILHQLCIDCRAIHQQLCGDCASISYRLRDDRASISQ
jgi:hypothetical protein